MAEYSPIIQHYLNTKKEYSDCVLFYRLGDFYEMFYEDAEIVSRELELTLTGKDCGQEQRAPMSGIPYHAAEGYIAKLIEKGYKVAICEQVEDPKTAKGIVKREVIQIVSAGTITNTDMISENDFNYIATIEDYKYTYIMSYADVLSGKVYSTYISHDEEKLISHIVNLNIKEIVVNNDFDNKILSKLKNTYNIYVSFYNDDKVYKNNNVFEGTNDEKIIRTTSRLLNYLVNSLKQDLSYIQHLEIIDI